LHQLHNAWVNNLLIAFFKIEIIVLVLLQI